MRLHACDRHRYLRTRVGSATEPQYFSRPDEGRNPSERPSRVSLKKIVPHIFLAKASMSALVRHMFPVKPPYSHKSCVLICVPESRLWCEAFSALGGAAKPHSKIYIVMERSCVPCATNLCRRKPFRFSELCRPYGQRPSQDVCHACTHSCIL